MQLKTGGPRSKISLEEKMGQVGLPNELKLVLDRIYIFLANDGDIFSGKIIGAHLTPTGDLNLTVSQGEILMKAQGNGVLKYKDRVEKEGNIFLPI